MLKLLCLIKVKPLRKNYSDELCLSIMNKGKTIWVNWMMNYAYALWIREKPSRKNYLGEFKYKLWLSIMNKSKKNYLDELKDEICSFIMNKRKTIRKTI